MVSILGKNLILKKYRNYEWEIFGQFESTLIEIMPYQ